VYCDPPYSMHAFDKYDWILRLWDLAEKKLIVQTTTESYRLPNADRDIYLADKRGVRCFQVFQVFERNQSQLDDFGD